MIEFMSHGCHQWTKVLVSTSIDHFQFDCDPLPSQSQEGDFWVEGFDAVTIKPGKNVEYCRYIKLRVQSL